MKLQLPQLMLNNLLQKGAARCTPCLLEHVDDLSNKAKHRHLTSKYYKTLPQPEQNALRTAYQPTLT